MALGIGIVGAGKSGTHKALSLQSIAEVTVTGVADPDRPRRDAFVHKVGVDLSVSDHKRLISHSSVDVVYICSPPLYPRRYRGRFPPWRQACDLLTTDGHNACSGR